MTRLLIGITAHGLGHLAQTAPVVAALRHRDPSLEITVLSAIARSGIEARIPPPVRIVAAEDDFGLVMATPFNVDMQASFRRYAELHDRYGEEVRVLADWLRAERFDGVLANISYLLTAAAHEAEVPALAMSSLNWHDLFRYYCGAFEGAEAIADQMRAAYARARCIARLEPAMAMPDFEAETIDAAIAMAGRNRRDELRRRYSIDKTGKIILFAMGGMAPENPPDWGGDPGRNHILFGPASWAGRGPWCNPDDAGVPFTDLVASADVVVTRPGYGTVTEIAAAGVPAILVSRGDWPEEPGLVDWLTQNGRCIYFEDRLEECRPDTVLSLCDQLAEMPIPPRPGTGGEERVAVLMGELLQGKAPPSARI